MGMPMNGDEAIKLKEAQIAVLEAQFLQEVKQLQTQLSGEGKPDPVIQLKQQELQQQALRDQARLQMDQQKLGFEAQKLQQKDKIDNARIESQEDIAQLRANVNLKKSKPSTNFIKDG
jgi:enoyl-CoA hydratase/carnithine racemase